MRVRSLGVRWNVARKAVSELGGLTRPKRRAFDASTLRLLEELCESTWAIVQDRHPFRDPNKENRTQASTSQETFYPR
jgi:hypothetical protein